MLVTDSAMKDDVLVEHPALSGDENELKGGLEAPQDVQVVTRSGEVLTRKYSFETFVVGTSNQFAHASAMAVSEKPCVYNPLFLAGKTGLGKTHLLKAIGYRMGCQNTGISISYISTQKFIEEVIHSIRHAARQDLHDRYVKNCNVLLVDDIQFLSTAKSTQDEFFHIFNLLHDAGCQIVIASDRLPKEIQDVNERLISRFEWGMVADIEAPELETRVAILKAKAEADKIELTDDVAYLVATYVKANIRELEGSLTKIAGHAAIYNVPISTELVKKVLKNYISEKQKIIHMDEIISAVAQLYGLKPSDLKGPSRKGPLARARQIAMYLARELTNLSTSVIGQDLGDRHHTTVLHGHSEILEAKAQDPLLQNHLKQLEDLLINR